MKHQQRSSPPLPEQDELNLETILGKIEQEKSQEDNTNRQTFVGEIVRLTAEGYDLGKYWNRFKKATQQISTALLLTILPTDQVTYICQPYLQGNKLIEATYQLRERDGKKFLIPVRETIVKQQATAEDIKTYKCGDIKQEK